MRLKNELERGISRTLDQMEETDVKTKEYADLSKDVIARQKILNECEKIEIERDKNTLERDRIDQECQIKLEEIRVANKKNTVDLLGHICDVAKVAITGIISYKTIKAVMEYEQTNVFPKYIFQLLKK